MAEPTAGSSEPPRPGCAVLGREGSIPRRELVAAPAAPALEEELLLSPQRPARGAGQAAAEWVPLRNTRGGSQVSMKAVSAGSQGSLLGVSEAAKLFVQKHI